MSEVKEIIWLTENYPPQKGGMAQSCDRIINGLRQVGLIIHIVHFTNRKEPFISEVEENGTYTPVPVHPDESHTLHLAINYLQKSNLKKSLLVVFGGYLPMLAAPIYKIWLDCQLLLMIRGNDFDAAIFSPKKRQILTDAMQKADLVSCVSHHKSVAIRKLFPDTKVSYVPNGIDPFSWQPLPSDFEFAQQWKSEKAKGKLVLGCFGHLKEKKGLDTLFSALSSPALKERIILFLIGDVTEQLLQEVKEHEVSFQILPFEERLNLIKYYLCCDCLVVPSHYDGMPNVLLEAGLLEIPVIASARDGMLDLITDKEDGLLFEAGDVKDLRRVLFSFQDMTEKQRSSMGKMLNKKIVHNFNSKSETEKYHEIIQSL